MSEKFPTDPLQASWQFAQEWLQSSYQIQYQYQDAMKEWLNFQQESLHANLEHGDRWIQQSLRCSQNPALYFRFLRRYWQKPWLSLSAQTLTLNQLQARMWSLAFFEWQKTHKAESSTDKP